MNFPTKRSYSYEELLLCGQGKVFGEDNGHLPLPNMLMVSRITDIDPTGGKNKKGYLEAELDITPDLWFFDCHFKGDPVMPGCLGLDAMWQLVGFFLTWSGCKGRGRALGVGELKFSGQVLPKHKKVSYKIHLSRVVNRKVTIGIGDATMEVDGREIYTAHALKVGLFESIEGF